MTTDTHTAALPLAPYIKTTANGEHYLAGSRCRECDEIFVGERAVCPRCCTRDQMDSIRLSRTGTIYAFTIVERSFPGVTTPFIDVIVDLDDGAHIKATLEGVEPTPDAITFDMPVEVVFTEVIPAGADGATYLTYSVMHVNSNDSREQR
jgi:uncharacterized OB-fold protein